MTQSKNAAERNEPECPESVHKHYFSSNQLSHFGERLRSRKSMFAAPLEARRVRAPPPMLLMAMAVGVVASGIDVWQ